MPACGALKSCRRRSISRLLARDGHGSPHVAIVAQRCAPRRSYIAVMEQGRELHTVPDDALLLRLQELVAHSHRLEADLVAHIGEVDERRLFARQAFPSMFVYCTDALHLSEAEAYRRITVARAARKHSLLLTMLRDGRLHLTGAALIAPFLTEANREAILARATRRTKREIEDLVAALAPRPDARSAIRKLPQGGRAISTPSLDEGRVDPAGAMGLVPERAAREAALDPALVAHVGSSVPGTRSVESLSPGRYRVQFTASAELRDKLERLKVLMRSEIPSGDIAEIVERAVTEKLESLEARRFAKTTAPRKSLEGTDSTPASRHIPAAVRRAVHERDGGRCRFVDDQGARCSERHRLEFHHRHPFAMGGDHSPGNVSLLCPAHNRYLAELDYGKAALQARSSANTGR